ncbi:hypothetical protein [Bacillus pretiosus]|uniref:hypothetical protein n=1 Tax=Bacillus pretiosus TaxID=2983392 RepID=UPI003D654CA8
MRAKWSGVACKVENVDKEVGKTWYLLRFPDNTTDWVEEEDLEEVEIECSECWEDKWVEAGTWALDKGICATCYCAYQGG